VKALKTSRTEALLWSVIIAVIVTGAVHAVATLLPDWFSARHTRQSAFEATAVRFSEYWLMNAAWLGGVLAVTCFAVVFAAMCLRAKSSSRRDNGAG
jgi:hypothetical protein